MNLVLETVEECNLCSSCGYDVLFKIDCYIFVQCRVCGLVRLNPRVAEGYVSKIYENYYDVEEILNAEVLDTSHKFRTKILEKYAAKREILEIGCGGGDFLAYLRHRGWQVHGLEVSARTVEFVKRRHGLDIFCGDFVQQRFPDGSFQVIDAYHVLEHVYHPRELLEEVYRVLVPDGLVHLQVPSAAPPGFMLNVLAEIGRIPEHVYFFTPQTLGRLLASTGFQVLTMDTYDPVHSLSREDARLRGLIRRYLFRKSFGALAEEDYYRVNKVRTTGGQATKVEISLPKELARRTVKRLAWVVARTEALVGRGNVVDLIARKESP